MTAKSNLTTLRRDMKFRIDTMSTTAKGMAPIKGAPTAYPDEPTIIFTRKAWVQQCHLVNICSKEVGWFALVDYDSEDNSFTIFELVIPEQTVTAAETDISKDNLADAAIKLIEEGKDTSKLYAWFHSHVNMGVSPSGQDEYQVEDFLTDLEDQPDIPAFIRGIQNKRGDLKLDVYYLQHGIAYQNVDFMVDHDDDPQWRKDISDAVKANVKERTYTYNPQYTGYNQWGQKNAGSAGNGFRRQWDYHDWDDDDIDVPKNPGTDLLRPKPITTFSRDEIFGLDLIENYGYIDVLQGPDTSLYVCDQHYNLYDYDEYIEYHGDLSEDATLMLPSAP